MHLRVKLAWMAIDLPRRTDIFFLRTEGVRQQLYYTSSGSCWLVDYVSQPASKMDWQPRREIQREVTYCEYILRDVKCAPLSLFY